jgi:ankyrin repeat protein
MIGKEEEMECLHTEIDQLSGNNPLHTNAIANWGISFGTKDEMECLNKANLRRETPLIVAVRYQANNSIRLLAELKADPDRRDDTGNTALHYAVNNQDIDAIGRLLQMNEYILYER